MEIIVITRIEQQVKYKERYNVYIDDVFRCGVHEATLIKYHLFKGREVSELELAQIIETDLLESLYLRAIRYLSHSLRSKKEVTQKIEATQMEKMTFQNYDERMAYQEGLTDKVAQVIQRLETEGYLNDRYYGECYVRTEATVGRKGPERIRQSLKQKGLSDALIEEVLITTYEETQQQENLEELSRKFIKKNHKISAKIMLLKLKQYLQQKGYSRQQIDRYLMGMTLQIDDASEESKLAQAGEKALRTHQRKYEGSTLWAKVKETLYRKGYDYGMIQDWVDEQRETF